MIAAEVTAARIEHAVDIIVSIAYQIAISLPRGPR